jgi:hypothetical protein
MAAYNYVTFEGTCPSCGRGATIRAQVHVASSFDGDDSGRYAHREYQLGERMAWWPPSDRRFSAWSEYGQPGQPPGEALEACYSECRRCRADVFAVIRFRDLVPTEVLAVGAEAEWPQGYLR